MTGDDSTENATLHKKALQYHLLFSLLCCWPFKQEVKMLLLCHDSIKWIDDTFVFKPPQDIGRETHLTTLNENRIMKRFSLCDLRWSVERETWSQVVWYERDGCMLVLLQQQEVYNCSLTCWSGCWSTQSGASALVMTHRSSANIVNQIPWPKL